MPAKELHQLLEAFIAGRDRSRRQVALIEAELAEHFDNDPRFADLQYELAMYGADDHPGDATLVKECEWALNFLAPNP